VVAASWNDTVPKYEAFHNQEAYKAIEWMACENDRIKQARLYRTACRMEKRFRDYHHIPRNGYWRRGSMVSVPSGMWMAFAKRLPPVEANRLNAREPSIGGRKFTRLKF